MISFVRRLLAPRDEESAPALPAERSREEAFDAVRDGVGVVLFRHMRKAGGTSVKILFYQLLRSYSNVTLEGTMKRMNLESGGVGSTFAAIEWGVFPVSCFEKKTLLVTCLREPVSRQISEFWYSGPGYHRLEIPLDKAWEMWMAAEKPRTLGRDAYFDNYYVRALTGNCRPTNRRRKGVCDFGGAFDGGCIVDQGVVGQRDLDYALKILNLYDVVLVVELLPISVESFLRPKLGIPDHIKLTHSNNRPQPKPLDNRTMALLERDNAYDAVLYQAAKKRAWDDILLLSNNV